MNRLLFLLFCLFALFRLHALDFTCQKLKQATTKSIKQFKSGDEALRSDTVDVLNYNVYLDFTQANVNLIAANCQVKFKALMPVNSITLDLQSLTIDSIKYHNAHIPFSYDDTTIVAFLGGIVSAGVTDSLIVYYHGTPPTDPSGLGGFYFTGGYYFNLGVGYTAVPHNFGRVWHPCFDNFVERATYDFSILTNNNNTAYCNGLRQAVNSVGTDSLLTIWKMNQSIPTYLASVAVSSYTHVVDSYFSTLQGINIPIWLAAKPADTTNLKNSFVNLKNAMQCYENFYGPYVWDRVGYVLVPFNAGAVEHATNVSYPLIIANGSLTYETSMAHELSHHWWGDLVTCETAEEMWLNEGIAKYSEHVFTEYLYGYNAYLNAMRANHYDVLHQAHIADSGYYALNAVPLKYTYGDHSYNKGADVMHTLRSMMGDSNFWSGLKSIQNNYAHNHISSEQFRDELIASTGVDVSDFFNDWILNPGFSHFSISNFSSQLVGSNYQTSLVVKQKLKGASFYHDNIPLLITLKDENWNTYEFNITLTEQYQLFTFTTTTQPVFAAVNMNEKINDATTAQNYVITNNGTYQMNYANVRLVASNLVDSAFIRVEHNWVYPDVMTVPDNIQISKERYWNIHGVDLNNFTGTLRFEFNAKTIPSGNYDNQLLVDLGNQPFSEDSIVLLYRPNSEADWQVHDDYVLNKAGLPTDKYGFITTNYFAAGQYTFGYRCNSVSVSEIKHDFTYSIYPNPASNYLVIDLSNWHNQNYILQVFTMEGKNVLNQNINGALKNNIDISTLRNGSYILTIAENNGMVIGSKKIIVE